MNFNAKHLRLTFFSYLKFRIFEYAGFDRRYPNRQGLLTQPVNAEQYYRMEERNDGRERSRAGTLLAGYWPSGKQGFICPFFEDQSLSQAN